MNVLTHALRRFWWVVAIGLVAAAAAAYFMIKNEAVEYQASARLLVTSVEGPYFRTSIRREEELPSGSETSAPNTVTRLSAPDVRTLVQAANLYPLLVESDEVARLRAEMFGELPGTVTARAIGATVTLNRFEPGEVPVITVSGVASRPRQAIELTQSTVEAFESWIAQEQDRAGIPEDERILIQELQVPTRAAETGGESMALPVLVAVAVAVAFGALAILLDRIFPRRRTGRGQPEPIIAERIEADEEPIEELTAH